MSKDTFWFRHDSNARNDVRIVKLRRLAGLEAVGLYWCVVECLREANAYQLPETAIDDLCFEFRCDKKLFDLLFECELFSKKDSHFFSKSLKTRMKKYDKVCDKRRESGRLGGVAKAKQVPSKSQANAKQMPSDKNRKEKSRIEKNKYTPEFCEFWKAYPARNGKKVGKAEAFKEYKIAIKLVSHSELLTAIKSQTESAKHDDDYSRFVVDACRWLKRRRWEDEISAPPQSETPISPSWVNFE
jgi:hypothetical protein